MTGAIIRTARLRAGLSQEGLARVLNVASGTVSKWERGVLDPPASRLLEVMRRGGLSIWSPDGRVVWPLDTPPPPR